MEQTLSRLRAWRQAEGLSLSEMSGLTGVSVAMLSRGERGQKEFSPKTKVRMARGLGVQVGDLFDPPAVLDGELVGELEAS